MTEIAEVDARGRVVIPARLRKTRGIRPKDKFRIESRGRDLVLRYLVEEPKRVESRRKWGGEAFPCAGEATFGD